VVGKPNAPMLDTIKKLFHLDESKSLFIGDRLDTDIAFANNGNIDSLLVLTGISTVEDCKKEDIFPTYVLNSLGDLDQV
jgi:4-nitrophenyl phosphatase